MKNITHYILYLQNNCYKGKLKGQFSGQKVNTEELHACCEQMDSLHAKNSRISKKRSSLQQHIAGNTIPQGKENIE